MKILVTGGAGFIGSHVTDAYIAAGHEVAILDDFSTGNEANVNREAQVLRLDVRNREAVAAAITAFRPEVISTGGALYGEPDVVPSDEDHPVRPLSPYGTSKFSFEQYLGTFHRAFGLEYTVLRYANIYGPRQDFHAEEGRVIAIFASRMLAGRPVTIDGDGEQARDMLHVADAAVANIAALDRGANGTYHISSGIPVTVNELFRKLALLTDYNLEPTYGPRRKGDVFRIALDNSRALQDLAWEPKVELEEGLSLTVDYFREQVLSPH
jgi:UDP-glucose 4-epimerase